MYINYVKKEDQTRLLGKLGEVWATQPGWRLCQVLSNLHGLGPQDIFHTYDDKLEETLDKILDDGKRPVCEGSLDE